MPVAAFFSPTSLWQRLSLVFLHKYTDYIIAYTKQYNCSKQISYNIFSMIFTISIEKLLMNMNKICIMYQNCEIWCMEENIWTENQLSGLYQWPYT
jgi:hypothetical protein